MNTLCCFLGVFGFDRKLGRVQASGPLLSMVLFRHALHRM